MNFFSDIASGLDNVEKDLLGPDYSYIKYINNPNALGMSSKGTMGALESNVSGLIGYVELLIAGTGRASATGKPLGPRFFLKTPGKCKDYKSGKLAQRNMYINNVPDGNIPFLSEVSGMQFTELEGLVPGIFSNLDALNPLQLFSAFMEGENPICAEVNLKTIGEDNVVSSQSAHVPISELSNLQSTGDIPKNTVTPEMIKSLTSHVNKNEGFVNINDLLPSDFTTLKKKKYDTFTNMYYISISLLLFYLTYRLMKK